MTTTRVLLERVAAEYREMPGLSLTASQAARLWGLERERCVEVLQALVAAGRLRHTADGRFCAAGGRSREPLAAALGLDDERVVAALRQAGLDENTAALVDAVPPLYVAWADGRVSRPERREIDRLPRSDEVKATGRLGRRLLAAWLEQRPPDAFFEAALAACRARLRRLDPAARARAFNSTIADATMVAEASGGLLGFGAVSDAESRCLRDLAATLAVNNEKEQQQ